MNKIVVTSEAASTNYI